MELEDGVRWVKKKNDDFLVKALELGPSIHFPMKSVWKTYVQSKLCSFALEAAR